MENKNLQIDMNDPEALKISGYSFLIKGNHPRALEYYRMSAARGNADASFVAGMLLYESNNGVKRDTQEGAKYLTEAIKGGNKSALYYLEKQAKNKTQNSDASITLFNIYSKGCGNVKKDPKKAIYYLKQAARKGNPEAQFKLGILCQASGQEKEAIKCFVLAVNGGSTKTLYFLQRQAGAKNKTYNKVASSALGFIYQNGIGGVEKNQKLVFEYLKQSNRDNKSIYKNVSAALDLFSKNENKSLIDKLNSFLDTTAKLSIGNGEEHAVSTYK